MITALTQLMLKKVDLNPDKGIAVLIAVLSILLALMTDLSIIIFILSKV